MAADTLDIIQKLMALALNNPNEAESLRAALKAIQLIEKHQIPLGDTIIRKGDKGTKWAAPSEDFMSQVDEILKGVNKKWKENPDSADYTEATGGSAGLKVAAVESDVEDRQSAFQKQIIRAWRAIRDTRRRLETEIYRYERETGRKFGGQGMW